MVSIGYAGCACLEAQDEKTAIYSYIGENFNLADKALKTSLESKRGLFTISKASLVEPEVHSRIRKTPRGKKLVEEKIVRLPNVGAIIADGGVVVDELCGIDEAGCTYRNGIYHVLLTRIFEEYQKAGALPETAAFIV